jgi:hypothetical protein
VINISLADGFAIDASETITSNGMRLDAMIQLLSTSTNNVDSVGQDCSA